MTERARTDDRAFAARMHELHFGTDALEAFLDQLSVLAAEIVEADTSCGITVIRNNQPATVTSSDRRADTMDELQYEDKQGPCLHSARTGQRVLVSDVDADARWPEYFERAAALGLRASLSLPLALGTDAVGALNLYSFDMHRFDDQEQELLGEFADEAARAISLALRHHELSQQNHNLQAAMASRRLIDQALGILMAQNKCGAGAAFGILRKASSHRNVKIRDLAVTIIAQTTGEAPSQQIPWT